MHCSLVGVYLLRSLSTPSVSEECDPLPWCNALGGRALRLRLRAAPRTPARADTLARVRPLRARGGREIC